MSRTKKDAPYEVRAKRATNSEKRRHARWCNGIDRHKDYYTATATHIFYANEVAKMEEFREEIEESGSDLKVTEKSGYLISSDPNLDIDFSNPYSRYFGKEKLPLIREKVVDRLDGARGDHIYSSFDIFYIFEITKTIKNRNTGECCSPILPKGLTSKSGCSCCSDEPDKESRTKVRDELVAERKHYNAELDYEDDL
jgi:hypothetical protein